MKTVKIQTVFSSSAQKELHEDPSLSSTNNNNVKWSVKEKLFLISFILIHGDNDWPFISSQLNKWLNSSFSNNNLNFAYPPPSNNKEQNSTMLNKKTASVNSEDFFEIFVIYEKIH
jgi:hypothetical protein